MGALDELLARRVQRGVSAPVDDATVASWCGEFGSEWPELDDAVAPALMFPVFVRPPSPADVGASAPTGVVLHDELKSALELPVAIAVGYGLELQGEVRVGDRLVSTEGIASIGDTRATRLGEGREWVIDVVTTTVDDAPVGIERFRMLGYRPGAEGTATSGSVPGAVVPMWTETTELDAGAIVRMATANRVWAPAHHRTDAAQAAGLPDIILDTSSQVALLAGAAQRHRPAARLRSVDLAMKRPILPDSEIAIGGTENGDHTIVVMTVDGREVSRATVSFAT